MENKLVIPAKAKITARSIHKAHLEALIGDIKEVSLSTLLAGEVTVVTLKSIEGILEELIDFIEQSGVSKNHRWILKGLIQHFLLEKARLDGVIFIQKHK